MLNYQRVDKGACHSQDHAPITFKVAKCCKLMELRDHDSITFISGVVESNSNQQTAHWKGSSNPTNVIGQLTPLYCPVASEWLPKTA